MKDSPQHIRILEDAGRQVLEPLGLARRNTSCTWIDDRGWWLVVVEFQPCSWTKGAYLNVGVMWLWYRWYALCFHVGYRVEGCVEFRDADQFTAEAQRLAGLAAQEVQRYRQRFPSLEMVAHFLCEEANRNRDILLQYQAGVACGLAGRSTEAARFLSRILIYQADYNWERELQQTAATLSTVAHNTAAFQQRIAEIVRATRGYLNLTEVDAPSFDAH